MGKVMYPYLMRICVLTITNIMGDLKILCVADLLVKCLPKNHIYLKYVALNIVHDLCNEFCISAYAYSFI